MSGHSFRVYASGSDGAAGGGSGGGGGDTSDLETQISELETGLEQLQLDLQEVEATVTQVNTEMASLDSELNTLNQELIEADAEIAGALGRITTVEGSAQAAADAAAEAQRQVNLSLIGPPNLLKNSSYEADITGPALNVSVGYSTTAKYGARSLRVTRSAVSDAFVLHTGLTGVRGQRVIVSWWGRNEVSSDSTTIPTISLSAGDGSNALNDGVRTYPAGSVFLRYSFAVNVPNTAAWDTAQLIIPPPAAVGKGLLYDGIKVEVAEYADQTLPTAWGLNPTEALELAEAARALAATAQTTANNALTSADGKGRNFYQPNPPSGMAFNSHDAWFDTDNGYALHSWNGSTWVLGQFSTSALADDAVNNDKLANDAVDTAQIKTGAVTNAKVASLDAGKITAGFIAAERIATDTILAHHIKAGEISAGKLAADSVLAANIKAGEVVAGKLAANAVVAGNIKAGEISTGHMTANSINGDRILANSLTAAKISTGTLSASASIVVGTAGGARLELSGGVGGWTGLRMFSASNQPSMILDGTTGAVSIAGTFYGTNGSFSGNITSSAWITGGTFATASSGQRCEIRNASTFWYTGSPYEVMPASSSSLWYDGGGNHNQGYGWYGIDAPGLTDIYGNWMDRPSLTLYTPRRDQSQFNLSQCLLTRVRGGLTVYKPDFTLAPVVCSSAGPSSSRELKRNIRSLPRTGALSKVRALRPVSFIYNRDTENQEKIGFIAEEVEQQLPDVVIPHFLPITDGTDGFYESKGLDMFALVTHLTQAVQELSDQVDALRGRPA